MDWRENITVPLQTGDRREPRGEVQAEAFHEQQHVYEQTWRCNSRPFGLQRPLMGLTLWFANSSDSELKCVLDFCRLE